MNSGGRSLRELTVVAAVIRDDRGRLLLTQRPLDRHMGGLWEFPGGKVHPSESPADALVRELYEELGIEVTVDAPITFAVHEEPDLRILLLFYEAVIVRGTVAAQEGQQVQWVPACDLRDYPTPPADAELVDRLVEAASS